MRGLTRGAGAPVEQERLSTLARRLAAATSARHAEWQVHEPGLYTWSSNDGSVTIASRDRDGEAPYELIVHDSAGKQVDELSSELLEGDQPALWNDALAELHRVAHRSALQADDVIDALIEALPTNAEHMASNAAS